MRLLLAGFESWLRPVAKNNHTGSYLKSIHCDFLVGSHGCCLPLGSVLFFSWFCDWHQPRKWLFSDVFCQWDGSSYLLPSACPVSHKGVKVPLGCRTEEAAVFLSADTRVGRFQTGTWNTTGRGSWVLSGHVPPGRACLAQWVRGGPQPMTARSWGQFPPPLQCLLPRGPKLTGRLTPLWEHALDSSHCLTQSACSVYTKAAECSWGRKKSVILTGFTILSSTTLFLNFILN